MSHFGPLSRVIVACLVLGFAHCAAAQSGAWVVTRPGASESSVETLRRQLRVVQETPAGGGIRFWRFEVPREGAGAILARAEALSAFDLWDARAADLFSPVRESDLTPAAAAQLKKVSSLPYIRRLELVRIPSHLFATRLLRTGLGPEKERPHGQSFEVRPVKDVAYQAVIHDIEESERPKARDRFSVHVDLARLGEPIEPGEFARDDAVFTYASERIYGRIDAGRDVFLISPLGDRFHAVLETDASKFQADEAATSAAIPCTLQQMADTAPCRTGVSILQLSKPIVRIAVSFSNGAAATLPPTPADADDAPWQFAEHLIALTNAAFNTSGVKASVRLAGVGTWGGLSDTRTVDDILRDIRDPVAGLALRNWRDVKEGDILVAITNVGHGFYGWSPGVNEVLREENAFAVVRIDYAASILSFPHEVGHHFGAGHNCESGDPALEAYSRGFLKPDCSWRTIMSYSSGCATEIQRINRFSNCTRRYNGTMPGSNSMNNARVINENARAVSRFR